MLNDMNYNLSPVSMTELGIYLDGQVNPQSTAYNLPFLFPLPAGTDLERLKAALTRAFRAHPDLLARFRKKENGMVVRLMPEKNSQSIPVMIGEHEEEPVLSQLVQPFTNLEDGIYRLDIFHTEQQDYLFMDIHHIVFDGSGFPVLIRDINRAYEGQEIPDETLSAAEIAFEEQERRRTPEFAQAESWYQELLSEVEGGNSLIHDHECGEEKCSYLELPLGLNPARVKEYSVQNGIRTSTFFSGVYGYLLSRFTDSSEALYSTIHTGRNKQNADTIAMIVKTLPVLERFGADESIVSHLQALDKQIGMSRKNDLFSYIDITSKFSLNVPTMFAYQGDLQKELRFLNGTVRPLNFQTEDPKQELVAEVFRNHSDFFIRINWRTDLFTRETMLNFAQSYGKTAREFLEKQSYVQVDIVSEEQLTALNSFMEQPVDRPMEKSVVSLFREQARKRPDAKALIISDVQRSYGEVDALSDRIAYALQSRGIGKGSVVSVLIHRNEYMITASLGVLKAGACYQPLDPSYPPERLLFMTQDSGAALVIADADLVPLLNGYEGAFLLTGEIPVLPPLPEGTELPLPEEHDLFTLLYTSGSTGQPKGVMLEHGNLANFCLCYQQRVGMDENSIHSAYASYGFDANMMDMFPALSCGACVCIVPESIRLNLPALGNYLREHKVDISFMTTQVGRQFALSSYRPACLKVLGVGGEKLVPLPPQAGLNFYNFYGPTECTVFVTTKLIDQLYLRAPIGTAQMHAALYVVDRQGRRVPPCVPGELWIAGPGLARGYRNRPEKTAECFTPNPFCSVSAYNRVYHTGDIVRFLPNGEVDFIGRNDSQVKIRGFRIELSEIEAVIREFPAVHDVTVQAFDYENGSGKFVAAYLVRNPDQSLDKEALEAFIKERKPPYMVPSVFMELDEIPLTQNHKVDLRKLPKPERQQPSNSESAEREMTELEKELFEIAVSLIGSHGLGVATPLTDAGLTSISAMQLMVEIQEKFGFSPDVKELLQGLSILDVENTLVSHWRNRESEAEAALETQEEEQNQILSAPLSQTQLGIYLECRMDETSDKYNIPFLLKVGREADADRLAAAIRAAVDAHSSMKCSIEPTKNGGAEMILHPDLEWELSVEESELSDEDLEQELRSEVVFFKLSRAPLFRFRLIRTRSSLYLSMVFHHIIMDGTSVAVLVEDIERAYSGQTLAAESYSALNLAMDEMKLRQTDALKKAKSVFDAVLNGVSVNSLPAAEKSGSAEDNSGKAAMAEYPLNGVSPEEVRSFCEENKLTENALFTAAFAYLLARLGGCEEAMFASIYHGRTKLETLRITGMLVKTYPIYVNIPKNQSTREFIQTVQKRIQDMTANDLYSFAEAVRDYGVNADVMFAYQGDSFAGFTVAGQKATEIPQLLEDAKEPLSVDIWKRNGSYVAAIEYRDDLYTEKQTALMSDLYAMILRGLLRTETLDEVQLLSETGKAFIDRANDTDYPMEFRPAHCLLEASAAAHPERIAVVTPTEKMSYRELNQQANRVAHALIERHTGGRVVALMLPRTAQVYVVRQAILKAGSAFLSIDPSYPEARILAMTEDSETALLIVTEALMEERGDFLRSLNCEVVTVNTLLQNSCTDNPVVPIQKDDLAYCIFTSGSTGRPKGVMLTQGNLVNFLDSNEKNAEIRGYTDYGHASLALAAITFDVSIMEEMIPLAHGLTICMATEEEIHNPAALAKFMAENQVDIMTCTPSFLSNCIGLNVMRDVLKNVRSYDCGAEAFPAALYNKIHALRPDAYIMNGYGPTETTISCTMDPVTDPKLITIGRPAANVKCFILDENGNILPPLVPGELIIAGEGVGLGYMKLPELTKERFFTLRGMRAYHTGDIAAWTSDGRLSFHGRSDSQIKLRGLRIELGEIEGTINAYPDVLTSTVIMTGEENNKYLAAYYTASREISPSELKEGIGRTLTSYMVPSVLIQLDEMPLTQNGKIDKKRLPKVEYTPVAEEYVAPTNGVEKNFCKWFAELLNLERVSVDGNFFELGGTSLSASVIALSAAEKGYPIVYADVFKAQTPRKLAALVAGDAPLESDDSEMDEIRSFDYSQLPLHSNVEAELTGLCRGEIGNLLLTGATGFLGIHMLREYLQQHNGKAYCLLRGDSPLTRLKALYFYYFDEMLEPYLDCGRVEVISGDITDRDSLEACSNLPFDTLINCAALVKHFVKDDSLERINVLGVKNLIELCESTGKRLIQTSTVSVAGEGLDDAPPRSWMMREYELYNGQILENAYAATKFKAEKAVLEGINRGLDAKIMRLGNLMGRYSDGEFQANFRSNAFIRSLASYKAIGAVPYSVMNSVTDFSEIDMTSRAILLLAGTESKFTVFHPVNNHNVTIADTIYSMREYGFRVDTVEDDEFAVRMSEAGEASGALVAYKSKEGERRYMLGSDCSFTTNALYRLGFKWPASNEKYIVKMIESLDGLSMFSEDSAK